nr:hypothetical protein [Mycobacterium sp. E802]
MRSLQFVEFRGGPTLACQTRNRRLDQASILHGETDFVTVVDGLPDDIVKPFFVFSRSAHKGPTVSAPSAFDQTFGLELSKSQLDRGSTDTEHLGELSFGRQRRPWRQETESDLTPDEIGYVPVDLDVSRWQDDMAVCKSTHAEIHRFGGHDRHVRRCGDLPILMGQC